MFGIRRKRLPSSIRIRRRRRRKVAIAVVLASAVFVAVRDRGEREQSRPVAASPDRDFERYHDRSFRVVYVVDGDTLDIDAPDGDKPKTRIRLWGVDTPEVGHGRKTDMHFGPEAKRFAEETLDGRNVHVVLSELRTRGKYGRLLAYVFLERGGRMFNEVLLEEGYAYADLRFEHHYYDQFEAIEKRARRAGVGLWKDVTPDDMPPWRRRAEAVRRWQPVPSRLSLDQQYVRRRESLDRSRSNMKATDDPSLIAKVEHDTWERCAEGYVDGFGALVSESIAPLLDAACVGAHSRVLDIGTGPGLVAAAVRDRQATAIGIDFSESMVAEARRRYSDIEFRQANAEILPFDASEFDAVVGNFVLHHLACPEKVLTEAHRVLRDDGKAAFTVWSDLTKLAGFGMFLGAMEKHADLELPHGPLFGVSDFGTFHDMLREAGFHNSAVNELNVVWRITSIDSYLNIFRVWSDLDALPDSVQTAVEATVRENARTLISDGVLALPNPAILISATK